MSYSFRLAETADDFRQIRRLNYLIFSEELGQHAARADGLLTDPFEARSRFFIALHHEAVVGMICAHDDPPWSVEKRLPDPAILATLAQPVGEFRLLALAPYHRNRLALLGLLAYAFEDSLQRGYRTLIISGITGQLKMYRRMGFVELGPAVPDGQAAFYPMALDLRRIPAHIQADWRRYQRRTS